VSFDVDVSVAFVSRKLECVSFVYSVLSVLCFYSKLVLVFELNCHLMQFSLCRWVVRSKRKNDTVQTNVYSQCPYLQTSKVEKCTGMALRAAFTAKFVH